MKSFQRCFYQINFNSINIVTVRNNVIYHFFRKGMLAINFKANIVSIFSISNTERGKLSDPEAALPTR